MSNKSGKALRERRKSLGLCVRCGNPVVDSSYVHCGPCRERQRKQSKKYRSEYNKRKDKGLCPRCGGPRDTEKETCSTCLNKRHQWYVRNRNLGLCTRCGKHPVLPGKTSCQQCYAKEHRQHQKAYRATVSRREELKAQGLCTKCQRPFSEEEKHTLYNGKPRATCEECRAKNRIKQAKKRNWRYPEIVERDGCCQICGRTRRLHVHHIDGNGESQNGQVVSTSEYNDDPNNLITLCSHCHYGITCLRQAPAEKRGLIIKLILA